MSPQIITLIIVLAICVAAFILLYFQGKRNMKKRDEQQAAIDQAAQWVNMLIIDKKKLPVKKSGLPHQIYDQIPVKKEVKASVSGLFISDVRGLRGPLEKPEKKKPGFFARLTGQK